MIYFLATRIICVTEGIKRELVKNYGVKGEICKVIPNGVNINLFKPLDEIACRRKVGLKEGYYSMDFVGSFQPWQGLHTLIEAMKGVDYVFHLAALWLLHCQDYPRAAFKVNIEGTFNVIEACVRRKIRRLVYSSSASVYGDALYAPMDESHPFNNKSFYGATKIAGEQRCRPFYHRYGLDYVGFRYMNVYGPRQDYGVLTFQ